MGQYPIASNVAILGASIDALKAKMVTNLTSKGVGGGSTAMTLTQLVDKVLEVKYQPIARSAARRGKSITPNIDASLSELSETLSEAHTRFKLKLEVMGVIGLTDTMTFNQYADKILEMKTKPQYELYPRNITVGANGSYAEFYFNTKDAVKVDFAVSGGFTLDRTTGQGAGNFIIRVSGTNNTTATAKMATVTVTLDNGEYPSETIAVTQAAGVQVRELVNPYLMNYQSSAVVNSIRARGGEIFFEYQDSVVFMYATYNDKWNGITVSTKDVVMDSFPTLPEPFIVLTDGVTRWVDHLTARNNTTSSERSATIVGYDSEIGLSVSMVVTQAAGSVAYTFTGTLFDTLNFYANGLCKSGVFTNYTGFGATIRTYWNGIETASEYLHTSDPRCTIEVINNGGGFYVQAGTPYRQALYAENRTNVIGADRLCNVRCVYSEAGKGTFYSEYVTVTQDANRVEQIINGGYFCEGYTKFERYTDYYTSGAASSRKVLIENNSPDCGYNPIPTVYIGFHLGIDEGRVLITRSQPSISLGNYVVHGQGLVVSIEYAERVAGGLDYSRYGELPFPGASYQSESIQALGSPPNWAIIRTIRFTGGEPSKYNYILYGQFND